MAGARQTEPPDTASPRFPADVLYRGACLYYEDGKTQAEIAHFLGISRATVSRLLAEARATGIVRIEVRNPAESDLGGLGSQLARHLRLGRVVVTSNVLGAPLGPALAPAVADLLKDAALGPGDALLVSSGATVYEIAREPLLPMPGVLVAPSVGGQDEPEAYYQTNEITRRLAVAAGATPVLLHAPVAPSGELFRLLQEDPSVKRVMGLWRTARAALVGIGQPPRFRSSVPSVMTRHGADLTSAVGDICTRPYDASGREVAYLGSERIFAMELSDLGRVEHAIGVAVGVTKAEAIRTAARAGYISRLVTDVATARAILDLPEQTGGTEPRPG